MEVCLLQNKHYAFLHISGKRNLVMPHTCFILAFARLKQTKNKSSRLWDKGGALSPKISFQLFGPHFGLKIRGTPGSSPGSTTAKFPKLFMTVFMHTIWKYLPVNISYWGEKELYGQNSIKIKPIKHFGALKVLLNMIKNLMISLEWVLWSLSPGLWYWDGVWRILSVCAN